MTATVGNYTIGYGDLYTNAYSIEAMEVSYVKISVIVFLMYIYLLFLLFFFLQLLICDSHFNEGLLILLYLMQHGSN